MGTDPLRVSPGGQDRAGMGNAGRYRTFSTGGGDLPQVGCLVMLQEIWNRSGDLRLWPARKWRMGKQWQLRFQKVQGRVSDLGSEESRIALVDPASIWDSIFPVVKGLWSPCASLGLSLPAISFPCPTELAPGGECRILGPRWGCRRQSRQNHPRSLTIHQPGLSLNPFLWSSHLSLGALASHSFLFNFPDIFHFSLPLLITQFLS